MATWDIILDERLVTVYNLDEKGLADNRRGKMTAAQQTRLQKRRWRIIRRDAIRAALALLAFVLLGFLSVEGILSAVVTVIRGILLIIGLATLIRIGLFHRRTGQEIAAGKVRMYPGRLNKVVWNGMRIVFCERGEFYNLPDEEWNAFDHYGRYRVYATPYTNLIVGAQPVDRHEPLPEAWRRRDDRF